MVLPDVFCCSLKTLTVGALCITNAKSITSEDFAAVLRKLNFRLFSFCIFNFAEFAIRNKKKNLKKFYFSGDKFCSKKLIFFHCRFLTAFPRGYGDTFFKLFSLRRISFGFSKNPCAKSITNRICVLRHCSTAPPSPGHGRADGRTSAGRSSLKF
jgi:hypothetical protein